MNTPHGSFRSHRIRTAAATVAVGVALGVALGGCSATMDRSVLLATEPVVAVSVGEQAFVSAFDLAQAMLRAGFTRDEVLKLGPSVHSALATSGGAQVRQNKQVSAIFAVYGDRLYVTSLARGTFAMQMGLVSVAG
jgi:hypothetical protein